MIDILSHLLLILLVILDCLSKIMLFLFRIFGRPFIMLSMVG